MTYISDIVIAQLLTPIQSDEYQWFATIITGDTAGEKCFVKYKGRTSLQREDEIIVRLESPNTKQILSSFLNSIIPQEFESGSSENVILYSELEEKTRELMGNINLGSVKRYFIDPGYMVGALYFADRGDGFAVPYRLGNHEKKLWEKSPGSIRPLSYALRHYLKFMDHFEKKDFPRVVIIDDTIDFQEKIIPIFKATNKQYLRVQPINSN